jgi:hypothetical protein
MKLATSWSLYDSASSRAQAPQAGAAEKSINKGLFWALAWASAASTSLIQLTSILNTSFQNAKKKSTGATNPPAQASMLKAIGQDAKREGLGFCDCLIGSLTIGEHTGKLSTSASQRPSLSCSYSTVKVKDLLRACYHEPGS